MRVLVTGSSGFLGRHVIPALQAEEHEVWAPTRKEINLLDYTDYECDMDTPRTLASQIKHKKVDAVIHLAATCGGIGINKDNPGKFMYENLQMGINVLEAARLAGVKKVVNLGTVCAYPKFAPIPFKEEDIWNGYPEETNAPYGIAKKTVMELGKAYYNQYGLNVTNLVPVNMAGEYDNFDPYSSHVLPALIRNFEEVSDGCCTECNAVTLWGTGSASREFLYAGDCARAIATALEKDTGPEPINLGTGHEITIKDLAELVKRVGGYSAEIYWDHSKPDGQPRRSLDVSIARNVLRWEATTSLDETIARTIRWYRSNV